jgi:hypothetical protein
VTHHPAHHITPILSTSIDPSEWIKQIFHIVLPSAIFETFNIFNNCASPNKRKGLNQRSSKRKGNVILHMLYGAHTNRLSGHAIS